jgi:putative DNA primase/helicase
MNSRIPPNEKEVEQSVLASILIDSEYREKAVILLTADDFYASDHQTIFEKCQELSQNGNSLEAGALWAEFTEDEQRIVGSAHKLSKLLDAPIASNIDHYIGILKDRKARRRTIELVNSIAKRAHRKDGDPSKIQRDAEAIIEAINSSTNVDSRSKIAPGILDLKNFTSMKLSEKRTFLDPWITEQSITLISGWRGVGKSWLALGAVDAISKGEKFGPWTVENSIASLYLDGEMAAQDLQFRALELNMGVDTKSPIYIYSGAYSSQLGLPRANLLDSKWQKAMMQYLLDNNIKLWVADNIGSLAPGINENVKEDYDPINQWLLDLRFSGISTILLHHTGKEGDQRGTSAREDNIDTSIILKQPGDYTAEDGCRFIMKFKKNRVVSGDQFLLADLEFTYERGKWSFDNVKNKARDEILKLLDEGYKQKDIAQELNIDPGYVSRIRKKAIQEGHLAKNNKLTPTGFCEVDQ